MTAWELAQVFGGRYEFLSVRAALDDALVETLGPCLSHTRLVCYKDVGGVTAAWTRHGFTELVGQVKSSVLVCRKEWAPGYAERGDSVKAASVEALKENAVVRKWFNEETLLKAPMRTGPPAPAAPKEVIADPKARMARARSFIKMSPAEAGRRGALNRARREVKP